MQKIEAKHINYGLIFLTAFLIPIYQPLVRYSIGLLVLSNFFNLRKEAGSLLKILPLLGYFIWLGIGLIWTDNTDAGWKEIEYNLSFLIFPMVFWFTKVDLKDHISRILSFFSFGYIVSIIICLILATYNYIQNGDLKSFYYAELSFFHHPTYMAVFGSTSLIYLYLSLISPVKVKTFYFKTALSKFALISVISIFILMLMSKAGILSMLIINIVGVFAVFKSKAKLKQAFIVLSGMILIVAGSYFTITPLQNRIDEAWNSLSSEEKTESSTGARILVWESSWQIIKQNSILGVGTGDLSNELDNIYREKQYTKLLDKSLNSHNQFLQSWAKNGIIGFLSLISLFIYAFWKNKSRFYLYFVLLIIINMMMESMLQIQSGIVFIAFMNSLLAVAEIRSRE